METKPTSSTKRFGMPGRYVVNVKCADDLTKSELAVMLAWFETVVDDLQKREEFTYTEEEAIRWQNEAAGVE